MLNDEFIRRMLLSLEDDLCKSSSPTRFPKWKDMRQHERINTSWRIIAVVCALVVLGGYIECASGDVCNLRPAEAPLLEGLALVLNVTLLQILIVCTANQLELEPRAKVLGLLYELHSLLGVDTFEQNVFESVRLSSWRRLKVTQSNLTSMSYCFSKTNRKHTGEGGEFDDYEWNLRPDVLLTTGDVVALEIGSHAPANVQLLPRSKSRQASLLTFERGERITVNEEGPEHNITSTQHLRLFKVLKPPMLDLFRKFLRNNNNERSDTMLPELWRTTQAFALLMLAILLILGFIVNLIHLLTRTTFYTTFHLLFTRQATIAICMLPNLTIPVLEHVLEWYGTAKLLSLHEDGDNGSVFKWLKILAKQWKPTTTRVIARSSLDLTPENRPLKHKASTQYNTPLRQSRVLKQLGSLTVLCAVDQNVVLDRGPEIQEVFLPKGDHASVSLKLNVQENGEYIFEDKNWKEELLALKAVALAALASSCLHLSPNKLQRKTSQKQIKQKLKELKGGNPVEKKGLSMLGLELELERVEVCRHLRPLAVAVGVPLSALASVPPCLMLEISDRSITPPQQPRTELSWSFYKNIGRVYCLVIEDTQGKRRRKNGKEDNRRKLHLLSWGHPQLLVKFCAEYWDGESIWPLRATDRSQILELHKQWTQKDSDSIAFAYTPIPTAAAYLFPKPTTKEGLHRVMKIEMKDRANSEIGEDSAKNQILKSLVMKSQIFTGMVRSHEKPRPALSKLIEKLDRAGIRFVHFSPRAPRRARLLAEKMGLETDWNTSISLLPIKYSKSDERSEWDVKAKLPHGVSEIRYHLQEVDDVPLRVPMFTDSQPRSTTKMIEILMEYGEVVCAFGSLYSLNNADSLLKANVSIAIRDKLSTRCCKYHGSYCGTPQSDENIGGAALRILEIGGSLTSLGCSLVMPTTKAQFPYNIQETLKRARQLLSNYKQSLVLALSVQLLLSLYATLLYCIRMPDILVPTHVLWLVWIQTPLFALPLMNTRIQKGMMRLMPSKNDMDKDTRKKKIAWEESKRIFYHMILRSLISAILLLLLSAYTLSLFSDLPLRTFFFSNLGNFTTLGGNSMQVSSFQGDVVGTQAVVLCSIVWCCVCNGPTHMYRNISLFKQWPRNPSFWSFSFISIALQVLYGTLICRGYPKYSAFGFLSRLDWICWTLGFVFIPLISISFSELTKKNDRKYESRNNRRLRLLFETRLGMYSPR